MPPIRTVRIVTRAEFAYRTARPEGELLDETLTAVRALAGNDPDGPAVEVLSSTVSLDDMP
jgi:hypothetical protein